jgi:hypothetical protein
MEFRPQEQLPEGMDDEDDDDLEQQFMQQLQQNPNIGKPAEDDGEEEVDEDDLKMYEQFLAQNKQQEHQAPIGQNISNINADEEDGMEDDMEGEIDLDNIDYEQLDPQILEIAEQMGVHPREVLKQIMQMNNDGMDGEEEGDQYGDEDMEGEDEDKPQLNEDQSREEQLRMEKELFKM